MMGSSELDTRVAGLVGRRRERAVIDRLIERAAIRESASLVIRAEAGMGKTALLRYAAEEAREMLVLTVTGVEAESDLDYSGLHSLVRPIVGLLPRLPEPQRAAVAAALGLAPVCGADRFLISAGVLSLLAAAAEDRPVLCLADDAQWLDVPSVGSLVFTARRLGAEGVASCSRRARASVAASTPPASTSWSSPASIPPRPSNCSIAASGSWRRRCASGCSPMRPAIRWR
jgi:hypothetical protein